MILLDTNIVSEFMKAPPAVPVLNWLNDQDVSTLYFSTTSIGEISYGLCSMPPGRRRQMLADRFEQFLAEAFEGRILSYDEKAARIYGEVRALRRQSGRPMSDFDGQIAAIARCHGLAVATRNARDFRDCGLDLIDPFTYEG